MSDRHGAHITTVRNPLERPFFVRSRDRSPHAFAPASITWRRSAATPSIPSPMSETCIWIYCARIPVCRRASRLRRCAGSVPDLYGANAKTGAFRSPPDSEAVKTPRFWRVCTNRERSPLRAAQEIAQAVVATLGERLGDLIALRHSLTRNSHLVLAGGVLSGETRTQAIAARKRLEEVFDLGLVTEREGKEGDIVLLSPEVESSHVPAQREGPIAGRSCEELEEGGCQEAATAAGSAGGGLVHVAPIARGAACQVDYF